MQPLHAFTLLISLAACTTATQDQFITSGETFQTERVVLIKGVTSPTAPRSAYLQRRSYTVTCAPGDAGGAPKDRAKAMMDALPAAVGQVYPPTAAASDPARDARAINRFAVPRYRCSVGAPDMTGLASDRASITRWAAHYGAAQELIDEAPRQP